MDVSGNYRWEAERDGFIFSTGGDLKGCSRFSIIPNIPGLPRHDFIGKIFKSRFNRCFIKTPLFGYRKMLEKLKGKISTEDQKALDLIQGLMDHTKSEFKNARKNDPTNTARHHLLRNNSLAMFNKFKQVVRSIYDKHYPSQHYFLCVIYQGGRSYINCFSGSVISVPEDYELNV